MNRITEWREAFEQLGLDPNALPDVSMIPEEDRKSVIAQYILPKVVKVLNGDWVPDYTDTDQRKYELWLEVETTEDNVSGSGLSCGGCDYWHTVTGCGVRLCFKDAETAKYCFNQFKELYEDLYLIKK